MPKPVKPPIKGGFLNKPIGGIKGKWWLLGGTGTAGIAYYMYEKNQNASDTTTDPNIDPSTGVPYADEQSPYDQSSGYGDSYGTSGFGGGPSDSGGSTSFDDSGPSSDDGTTDTSSDGGTTTSGTPSETNQQWSHEAIASLEAHGYTPAQAKAAVAAYLAGIPLTKKEEGVVEAAVRFVGSPPEKHPSVRLLPGPSKVTTTRKTRTNPPGKHNTTVKTVKTTKVKIPLWKRKHKKPHHHK